MIERLVIFGAAGDLTSRYLLPALARLREDGYLSDGFRLDAISRDDLFTDAFRDDEAEEAWRIVEPILDTWRDDLVPMRTYEAGSEFEPETGRPSPQ